MEARAHRDPFHTSSTSAVTPERDCVPPVAQQAVGEAQLMLSSWPPFRAGEDASSQVPPAQCTMIAGPEAELPPTAQQSEAPGQAMAWSAALRPSPGRDTLRQVPAVSCCSSGWRASDSVLPPGALAVWPTAQHWAALGHAIAFR